MNPTLREPLGTSRGDAMGREAYVSVAVVDDSAVRAAVVAAHVSRMQLNVSRGCSADDIVDCACVAAITEWAD